MLTRITPFLFCLLLTLNVTAVGQSASEATLASVRRSDAASRDANGNLKPLPAAEHMRRAAIYLSVRAFAEARDHWRAVLQYSEAQVPGTGEAIIIYPCSDIECIG